MADAIVTGLLAAASNEATLVEQYRLFKCWAKAKDVLWLAHEIKTELYKKTEWFLMDVCNRIQFLGGTVTYQSEPATQPSSIGGMFDQAESMEEAILKEYSALAAEALPSDLGTFNLIVHLVKRHERILFFLRQQNALVKQLGESGYVGSRLSDDDSGEKPCYSK